MDEKNKTNTSIDETNNEEEYKSLNLDQLSLSVATDLNVHEETVSFNYYDILRRVLVPFVLSGAPLTSVYLKEKDVTKFRWLSRSGLIWVYSIIIAVFIHILCGFSLLRVGFQLFDEEFISRNLWDDIFTFLYSFAGVVALDILWIRRKSLRRLILSLDQIPLMERTVLITDKYFKLKYRLKIAFLTLFAVSLMTLCFSYVAIIVVVAFNADVNVVWTDRIFRLLPLYSLYLVLFVISLYIVLCWVMKFKFEHLNKYIESLKKNRVKPSVDHLEIIKKWYKNNLNAVQKIDDIFNVFMFGFFAGLFFGIVIQIEEVISTFEKEHQSVIEVVLSCVYIGLMLFTLFYTIKQTSDVNQHSVMTKDLLYEYMLSTKPEDRSEQLYEELNLIIPGLLSNQANLTLLTLVNLNKGFMATAVMFIYTYTVLFKQFASDSTMQLKNITEILNNVKI